MSAKSADNDDGLSIGGTIKSRTAMSETRNLETESFFLDVLVGAGNLSSKNNKLCCENFLIAKNY